MPERQNLPYLTVTTVNTLIKYKLEGDSDLRDLTVKGEISNWKRYRSGVFFDLVDGKGSVLSCTIWSDSLLYLTFEPKDGDEVIAYGNISVYAPRGRYSLQVRNLQLFGQGAALLALEALKKKLAAEGLFDPSRKRAIPRFPKAIGIIVGRDSAAEADLLRNIKRRWPLADIYDFPAQVQGADAPKSVIKAILKAQTYPIDTLIVARGGGSNEDLSAFNDEQLVRTLAACKIPTISAVGHEIDITLIDYVSDLRVSTPTGAAEAATPDQEEIREQLLNCEDQLKSKIKTKLSNYRDKLKSISSRPFFQNPGSMYQRTSADVTHLKESLELAMRHLLELRIKRIESLEARLKSINPENVIKRGYSLTMDESGMAITSAKNVKPGQTLKTKLKDGIIVSKVTEGE